VVITCQVTYTTNSWYGPYSGTATSAGSGFVISDNGYIITNYHVIDNADVIKVTFYDGTEYEAKYVGGEESNDLAVLKIDASGLTPVVLGDSDTLEVGATVSTIGNALGSLSFSQTSGAVSGLGRSVTYSDGFIISMIQTDCTINSGNSGGPLFDQYGRVVGITSAKYSNNADSSSAAIENIGFAVPINDVKNIITDILEHGYVVRPYLGITVATVTNEYAQIFGWPKGVYVNSVEENSCSAKAGLQKGDIITKVGDTEITSNAELTAAKNKYSPGDSVDLTIYRSGETITLTVTFDASENPTESEPPAQSQRPQSSQSGQGNQSVSPFGSLFPFGF
jgi:serine protease Do